MLFTDIVGQEAIKSHLINTVKENRISHAQLFLGKEGYGSLALAIAYAQYIMCLDKKDNEACNECSSCRKINKLQHPDLHFSFPTVGAKSSQALISDDYISQWREFVINNSYGTYEQWLEKMDAGNSQGSIKVKEAESIVRKLSLKSFEAEFKIMVIWLPEKMNAESANKLLKLIEEPPEKTLFFLISLNSELIISTILSRTQLVKINRISDDELFIGLQQQKNIDEKKAREISRMSDGDYNAACNMIETSVDAQQNFEFFTQLMRLSYMGKFPEIIKWVDSLSKEGREKQKVFLSYSLKMIRENLIMNQDQLSLARFSDHEKAFAQKFSSFIHPENSALLASELNSAYMHISRNANVKVVFLDLCIKLNRMLKM